MRLVLVLTLASLCVSCATFTPPKPWEKGELAKSDMQFDPDPLKAKFHQHIYQSREAAGGGYGVGGGGCGCN